MGNVIVWLEEFSKFEEKLLQNLHEIIQLKQFLSNQRTQFIN